MERKVVEKGRLGGRAARLFNGPFPDSFLNRCQKFASIPIPIEVGSFMRKGSRSTYRNALRFLSLKFQRTGYVLWMFSFEIQMGQRKVSVRRSKLRLFVPLCHQQQRNFDVNVPEDIKARFMQDTARCCLFVLCPRARVCAPICCLSKSKVGQ